MSGLKRSLRELLRVSSGGAGVDLAAIDPGTTPGLPSAGVVGAAPKTWARSQVAAIGTELGRQQEMLFASAKVEPAAGRRVLLVLQAMDAGGKDGTIRRVAGTMNPLGLQIRSFVRPTEEERAHHFLWRIRRALPPPGYVGVFNRSHYEDVLVPRVESLVPEQIWRARYGEINEFEEELAEGGVTLLKVFLHISYEEQLDRLLRRLDDPHKHWKYEPGDVDTRSRWVDYQAAYAEALSRCDTARAPWFVVPANRKWYRDWAVANLLRETFEGLGLTYPEPTFDPERERRRLLDLHPGSVRPGVDSVESK
ncbi:PPK2 family polyphosphate:nucleotide phosphotransferase [Micromonospora pisi]|uniref:PPK2 family polyphosphate:nucleotide phosphotransferase n=1 Tax=Micromonospora pisi TaxID=589240 RepID=A0A495JKH4_9ACTN|nr:PPK2 family polyphosphate kinase [Micromonospora pisi]RKR88842.1 PPK2 family polyphosphate:nucleotide phosphotransferase [Micromonospora pisi]